MCSADQAHVRMDEAEKGEKTHEKLPMNSDGPSRWLITMVLAVVVAGLLSSTIGLALAYDSASKADAKTLAMGVFSGSPFPATSHFAPNPCQGKKPKHAAPGDNYFSNVECMVDEVIQTLEQAGANVTKGYKGGFDAGDREPIVEPYWKEGMCAVNVHWHLGAEHLSVGEFDEYGSGPKAVEHDDHVHRRLAAGAVRKGFQCHHYSKSDPKFNKPYNWQHCVDMVVGETYEVHWPHSAAGACGTPHQYQSPFYDGVFCKDGIISLDPLNTYKTIGVQGQVFTIVNDEAFYYPDLIRGMIVDGAMGADIGKYTGSTTGTSRNNVICSRYTPITWQVDRKCHMISASSFDKLCADMKAQRDDMSMDLHAHGARELVADHLVADNQKRKA